METSLSVSENVTSIIKKKIICSQLMLRGYGRMLSKDMEHKGMILEIKVMWIVSVSDGDWAWEGHFRSRP